MSNTCCLFERNFERLHIVPDAFFWTLMTSDFRTCCEGKQALVSQGALVCVLVARMEIMFTADGLEPRALKHTRIRRYDVENCGVVTRAVRTMSQGGDLIMRKLNFGLEIDFLMT